MRRPYLANGTRFERPEAPARVEHLDAQGEVSDGRTANVYPPNFGLLASDASWRTSWSHIVAGRFSQSHYSGLLFVEESTGEAELYDTDGQGRIIAPFRRRYRPLGGRASWTHVVPGLFGDSAFSGLLLYDRAAGFGRIFENDGLGGLRLLREYTDWRNTWTHIVAGRFVPDLPYASLFFYSAIENYAEIWATDRHGLAGRRPQMTFPEFSPFAFTQVVGGDFHWTPGRAISTPTLTDLFFYHGASGYGEMRHMNFAPDSSLVFSALVSKQDLPRFASVVAGSFGGVGNADLAFYERKLGTLSFYAFENPSETTSVLVQRETRTGLRRSVDQVVSGNFWMSNEEDHWFADGPTVPNPPFYDPDWRFNVGPFSDLLLYDREAGLGETYFHEPHPPTAQPLTGYVTSFTSVAGGPLVSTGSVLPGERVAFHISSDVGRYAITIHQLGYFGDGQTERFMLELEGLDSAPAPRPIDRDAYRDGAQWPESASLVVPREWPSALYVARVRALRPAALSIDLPFVVRARPSARVGITFVLADTTYCAYNDWGGRNSYGHLSGDDFVGAFPSTSSQRIPYAFRLSFERPSHATIGGNLPEDSEIPFLRWLGRRGIAVDVCTSRDLHFEAPSSRAQRLLLFVGHHEYWTAKMRDHVEGFVRSGGNVGIFSGNTCWWQVRLSEDGREQICYKVAGLDPVSSTSEYKLTTVHWFDRLVNRPETRLTGVSWLGDGGLFNDNNHHYVVRRPEHWVFAGTNLELGASFGFYRDPASGEQRSVVGTETDRIQTGESGLTSPANYTLASVLHPDIRTLEVGTMGIFRPSAESGQVFNAATINWALGLSHDPHCTSVLDRITLNVIAGLGPARAGQWSSVSEGSTLPGAPIAAVAMDQNEVALFLADAQGGVYTTSGSAEHGFRPWTSVSEGSTLPGAPISAVLIAPNRIALFLADPSGGVYTTSGNPRDGWRPWTSVSEGSTTPGGHVTALLTGQSQIALFLADRSGSVYTSSGNPDDGFGPWSSVAEGSTMPGAMVTAVRTGLHQISLFLADPGGGVYTISGNAEHGWGLWTSVSEGSTTPGAPIAAARAAQNQVALFVADPSGGIYTATGNAQGWGSWSRVSELMTLPGASITALPTAGDRISLFLADRDGEAATTSGSPHDGWRPWMSLFEGSTTPGAPLAAVLIDATRAAVFLADRSGGVYTATVPVPLG